jgi:FdhD protein
LQHRNGAFHAGKRHLAEEVPVAFSFYGTTHAVMMASPGDYEDFAYGFSISEGIIGNPGDLTGLGIVPFEDGIDLQIELKSNARARLEKRRRHMAGPVGCGLCGIESIEEALRDVPPVESAARFSAADIEWAIEGLSQKQDLNIQTRAVHAAAFYIPAAGIIAMREDVGRHNALDKLIGAIVRTDADVATGAVVVTSRVSVEMVQKTAMLGAPLLIAISAPTALALDVAEAAGITVAAIARGSEFELFTHAERVTGEGQSHVA